MSENATQALKIFGLGVAVIVVGGAILQVGSHFAHKQLGIHHASNPTPVVVAAAPKA